MILWKTVANADLTITKSDTRSFSMSKQALWTMLTQVKIFTADIVTEKQTNKVGRLFFLEESASRMMVFIITEDGSA